MKVKNLISILYVGVILTINGCSVLPNNHAKITNLRSEYCINPLGIDTAKPRFGWILESNERGEKQTAYQILVASSKDNLDKNLGDIWDSGKMKSCQSVQVGYAGSELKPEMQYYWKVRVWNKDNRVSDYSHLATFEMGLMNPEEWLADWIEILYPIPPIQPETKGLNGYHSQVEKSPDVQKRLRFDLGSICSIKKIRLYPAKPFDFADTPGFLFPLRYRIDISDTEDFSKSSCIADLTKEDVRNPGDGFAEHLFNPAKGRFVELTVTRLANRESDNYAFALAEAGIFDDNDNNLALNAKVTASDSIEGGTWSLKNINDGINETQKPIPAHSDPAPISYFRKEFTTDKPIKKARVFSSALGVYELYVNGKQVGEDILSPGWTNYDKRVQYQTYDITDIVQMGRNVIGAACGEGWYGGRILIPWEREGRRARPKLIAQVKIEYQDGTTKTLITDYTWKCTTNGPIRSACIYDGESYDARMEMPGWNTTDYNDSKWSIASCVLFPPTKALVSQQCQPIQKIEVIKPVKLSEPSPGVYIFDMGQNFAGRCRMKLQEQAGTTVRFRYGEILYPDGSIYRENLTINAKITDMYTSRGGVEEFFEPHFTYHGFRYIEVVGLTKKPSIDDMVGCVIHAAAPMSGKFECSSPLLNKIMEIILWTQRSNMYSFLTDCAQRGERLGWMGDAQTFAQAACFNMDMARMFTKYCQDIRDAQTKEGDYSIFTPNPYRSAKDFYSAPAWTDAGVIIPWRIYENYGDKRILEEHFESARRYVDLVAERNPDYVWRNQRGADYGDWLDADSMAKNITDLPEKGADTPRDVFSTAFWAHSAELVSKMAMALGKKEDARKYAELAQKIKDAFNHEFLQQDGKITGDTQCGYALALHFNILPENLRQAAFEKMVGRIKDYKWHVSTGIHSTNRMMMELSDFGRSDIAYQLINNRTLPSWGFMVDCNATTIWERWDGFVVAERGLLNKAMNSLNHPAFGAVGEWMWRNIAGINPDSNNPGYKHFIIRPRTGGGLVWAKGEYDSIHGKIISDWKIKNGRFYLNVTVPANTTATVYVPAKSKIDVMESGKPAYQSKGVQFISVENGYFVFSVESGVYQFESVSF